MKLGNIGLNDFAKHVYEKSKTKGFWELQDKLKDDNAVLTIKLALVSCEVSEAIECIRKDNKINDELKEELADIIIRVLDICGGYNIDIENEILRKDAKNDKRPYKHGKNF